LYTNSDNIMFDIFGWTGCLRLADKCCVKVALLGGLLLPRGCVSRSVGSLVLSVGNKHYERLRYSCNGGGCYLR